MRPTSDQSKKAAGTYRPAVSRPPLNVPLGTPKRPEGLSEGAISIWDSIVPDLKKTGVLARVDWVILAVYSELAAEWLENPRALSAGKLKELRMIGAEMGLSMGSRLKIRAPESGAEQPEECPPRPSGKVVSISSLLSGTPKGSSLETSKPADMSASPAKDS